MTRPGISIHLYFVIILICPDISGWSFRGVVVNMLDFDIVLCEFEL